MSDIERFRDFDDALEDLEPVQFKMLGERYELPGELSIAKIGKITKLSSQQLSTETFENLAREYLGKEIYESLVKSGAGFKRMRALFSWLNYIYTGVRVDEKGNIVVEDENETEDGDESKDEVDPTESPST